jgi:hypothetical protein
MGTLSPHGSAEDDEFGEAAHGPGTWGGWYDTNDFQVVCDEDARNLADGLKRALLDLADQDALEHRKFRQEIESEEQRRIFRNLGLMGEHDTHVMRLPEEDVSPIEWFTGTRKSELFEFIAFCSAGEFRIG